MYFHQELLRVLSCVGYTPISYSSIQVKEPCLGIACPDSWNEALGRIITSYVNEGHSPTEVGEFMGQLATQARVDLFGFLYWLQLSPPADSG